MRAAVAVDAGGGMGISALNRLGMEAALVCALLIGVAGGAGNLLGRRFVGCVLYVGVAVHAGEHAAVDGILESLRIHVEANGLAIHFMAEGGVAVAGKARIRGRFWRLLGSSVKCGAG